jgi:asparagine synthase (glutamine-hydrolysing)
MAPPAHTDEKKWQAMKALANEFLSGAAIEDAGLLDKQGVNELFSLHEAEDTPVATQVQLDAVINHLLGVQIMHRHFVATDIPRQAAERAQALGWKA